MGNRALDEADVDIRIGRHRTRLGEVHDVDALREAHQIGAEIEKRELTAVAGAELVDRHARLSRLIGHGRTSSQTGRGAAAPSERIGKQRSARSAAWSTGP